MASNLIGKTVEIKEGWYKGSWGVVKMYDGDYYHIAIFGDDDNCPVFGRSEFKVPRGER